MLDQFVEYNFGKMLFDFQTFVMGNQWMVILWSGFLIAAGSVLGESLTYWAARLGGRPLVERLARRLRIDLSKMARAEHLFLRWGLALVLFGRILPGVRMAVSVPAGLTRMNFGLFLAISLGGAYLWNTLLVGVGYLLGFKLIF